MSMTLYNSQEDNPVNRAEYENPDNWKGPKWGPSYASKTDTRLWVPKKTLGPGTGWQLNTAQPKAKVLGAIAVTCLLVCLMVVLISVLWLQ
ncbi:MAG: hypothetical protein HQ523_10250 [Lentisphaerae bacterium]|nr:hypothetical protein [Lentisphaerota bacterium]